MLAQCAAKQAQQNDVMFAAYGCHLNAAYCNGAIELPLIWPLLLNATLAFGLLLLLPTPCLGQVSDFGLSR
jgi:hypothetical protein